jgi:hypothetical protein
MGMPGAFAAVLSGLYIIIMPAVPPQQRLTLSVERARVGRYEQAEFRIGGVPGCSNPDDPAQADVRLEIRTPSGGRVVMPAFYIEPFAIRAVSRGGRQVDAFLRVGEPGWRGRYAPLELGTHTVEATARVGGKVLRSAPVQIVCVPSARSGFVRISRRDPRFLETSDGRAFFTVGQNLAFIKDTFETTEMLRRLAENGVNFVRVWTCCGDWGMAIESRKSAWSRSWAWNPPYVRDERGQTWVRVGAEGVTAQPNWRMLLEPGREYVLSARVRADASAALRVTIPGSDGSVEWPADREARRHEYRFRIGNAPETLEGLRLECREGTAYVRDLQLTAAGSARNLLWDADPDRPILGIYNQVDCAMLDKLVDDAERLGVRLQLCVLTRDLYMQRLSRPDSAEYQQAIKDARNLMRYAVARWGASEAVAAWEYWNEMDPGKPTSRFFTEVGEYLRQTDPYHRPRTTSSWADAPADWKHEAIDLANMHWYMRPAEGERFRDAVQGVLEKAAELRRTVPGKPAFMAEFGLADNNWRPSEYAARDKDFCHLKQGLWASALSGLSGSAMAWWWEDIHARQGYRVYKPLSSFVRRIPWTCGKLTGARAVAEPEYLRPIGLQTNEAAFLWLYDSRFSWYARVAQGKAPQEVQSASVTLSGLRAGRYRPVYHDTDTGVDTTGAAVVASSNGTARVPLPAFRGDVALRLTRMPTASGGRR